jgi:opine dehydrogenase
LTTAAAHASGSISRACRESEPNATIKAPASLDHRYVHEDVGYGLVPFAALGRLAGVPTPTIDAIVHLVSEATGIRYGESGLTLPKMGLAGKRPEDLAQFLLDGR